MAGAPVRRHRGSNAVVSGLHPVLSDDRQHHQERDHGDRRSTRFPGGRRCLPEAGMSSNGQRARTNPPSLPKGDGR